MPFWVDEQRGRASFSDVLFGKLAVFAWWVLRTMYRLKLKRSKPPPVPPPITRTITAGMLRQVTSEAVYKDPSRLRDSKPDGATAEAAVVLDQELERSFQDFLDRMFGGWEAAQRFVIEVEAWRGVGLDAEAADEILVLWRRYGFGNGESVGVFLDRLGKALTTRNADSAR